MACCKPDGRFICPLAKCMLVPARFRLVVHAGDEFPGPLITALFEVLSFPSLMNDLGLNQALEAGLLHLRKTHDLALTQGGRYQGLYRLMAHPNPQIRAMVGPSTPLVHQSCSVAGLAAAYSPFLPQTCTGGNISIAWS